MRNKIMIKIMIDIHSTSEEKHAERKIETRSPDAYMFFMF